jgi:hypothetical protein
MKKSIISVLLGLLIAPILLSCENEDSKNVGKPDSDVIIKTKMSQEVLESVFANLEKNENRLAETRASVKPDVEMIELQEDGVKEAILPLIEDGEYIRQQVLAMDDLTEEEREVISNLDEGQLALASFTLNILKEDDEPGTGDKMECLTSAIGNAITCGGIVGGGVKGILYGVTTRAVLVGFGATMGGIIYAGMVIYSYQKCRGRR